MLIHNNNNNNSKEVLPDEDPEIFQTEAPRHQVEISQLIGSRGRWQRDIFIFMLFAVIPAAWSNLQLVFVAPNTDFWCTPKSLGNFSIDTWRNRSRPPVELGVDDHCYVVPFWRMGDNETVTSVDDLEPCESWSYDDSFYPSTIISKWNLVCDRQWLVSFTKSSYNVGLLIAVITFGQLSDIIGRHPTLVISYVLAVVAGISSVFSPSLEVYVFFRILMAMGGGAFYTTAFVVLTEMVSPAHRTLAGIAINFGWCFAFVTLPLIAWFVRHRMWLELLINLVRLLFLPFVIWLVPESYRWLLVHEKQDAFKKVVLKAAKKNGQEKSIKEEIEKLILKHEVVHCSRKEKTVTVFDLLKTPNLRMFTLVLVYNWFANSFVYFGLTYNVGDFSPNLYLNFFLFGVVEFPAYFFTFLMIGRMGRRIPLVVLMVITGVACIAAIAVPEDLYILKVFFPLLGKFCISMTYAIIYIYSVEIFPTVVRNAGLGAGSTCASIGSIAAPFVRELAASTFTSFPDVLYAFLTISSGISILLLPETNKKPMSDTLKQAENIQTKYRKDRGMSEVKIKDEEL